MTADQNANDQIARDDAHLRSLGIKPELRRTLGFLSNFAIAFSFISVSTGSFGNLGYGMGMGGPVFFWTWPIIVIGQLLVALVFAELASHYPVAGSIYQWSKRLSNRTLGWFTGWFYFWAQVVTVTAVAVIVAFVVDGLLGSPTVGDVGFLDSPDPTGITTMFTFIAVGALVLTTAINAFGVRLLSILNNIGVATEILGMLVFALILLFFANHQSPDVLFKTFGAEQAQNGDFLATFMLGFFMSVFILYGFDTAGSFGEETIDAGRQAPRGVISSVLASGVVGVVFLLAVILSMKDIPGQMAAGLGGEFPIANTILDNLNGSLIGGFTLGTLYLVVILVSVFVCTLAIQGAATRMMFSMGRDRHLPLGRFWGTVNPTFRTPANAAVAVGVLAALPILLIGPIGGFTLSIAATGLIYLSYFLCNIGVALARRKGWPHQPAWFNLGRWGMTVNILALIYGGVMIVNIGLWNDPNLFGNFGSANRALWNPFINGLFSFLGQPMDWLPAWPLYESIVGLLLVLGLAYYAVSVRGRAHDVESEEMPGEVAAADAVIG
ncbi:MAG TPA: amino acid permease [Candidatus Limnocylindria bacterium]|nr:amino acid permease [Candidatus Limnocylindria bacterium]